MNDKNKTKAQLIAELITLRQRVTQLETIASNCDAQKQLLQENNLLLDKVIDIAADAIIIVDENQKIVSFNQSATQVFGYDAEEIIGKSLDLLIPEQFRTIHHQHMIEFGHTVPSVRRMGERPETTGCRKNGEQFPINASIASQKAGNKPFFSITLQDLTQEKQREETVSENERFFDNIFTYSPIGMIVTDFAGNTLQLNQKFTDLFGYTLEDIPTIFDWFAKAYPEAGARETAIANWNHDITKAQEETTTETPAREYEIVCKDGTVRHVEITKRANKKYYLITLVGITERKLMHEQLVKELTEGIQREALLHKSEERLQYALIAGNLALWEWNYKISKGYFSPSYFTMLGYAPDEMAASTDVFYSLLHPDDLSGAQQRNHELATGQINGFEAEFRMRTKAGDYRWVLSRGQVVKKDIKGNPHRIIGIHLDITKRKHAEEALQEKQTELEQIFAVLPNAIIFTNPERHIMRVNRRFNQIYGYETEEVLHKKTNFLYAHAKDFVEQGQVRFNPEASAQYTPIEIEMRRKNGDVFSSEAVGTTVHNSKGQVVGYLGIIRDITKRKKIETEVAHQKILLQTIMDESNLVIYVKEAKDLSHVWVSKRFYEVLNIDPGEAIGKTNQELFGGETGTLFDATDNEVLAGNRIEKEESPDGEHIYWSQKFPINLPDGSVYLCGISTDITMHKQAENEQLRLDKLESLGVLAGGIAHDFNNLLTGLYGNIELTKMFLAADHPAHKYLDVAESSMDSATKLTDQLLTFAKGGDPIKEIFALGDTITDSALFSLRGSRAKLQIHIQPDLWLVEADRGQLSQVISNLVINAQQAMPTGGSIYITTINTVIDEQRYVQITVQDEGTGIPPQYLDKIFDPYFSTKQTGSGLGLASTYSIINKHNGRIQVSSNLNQGTRFVIQIPASTETEIDSPAQSSNLLDNVPPTSATILVLDDEEVVRAALGGMLEAMKHKVSFATDGQEAIVKYQEAYENNAGYDVVITDLTIPGGMGGQKAAQFILKINPQAKLIVSSGYATDPIMANYETYGFSGIVVKPYRFAELSKVIKQVLAM